MAIRTTKGRALRTAVTALSLAVGLVLVAGCGSDEEPAATGDVLAAEVFDAEATTIDGEPFDLGELADRDLVLWFWAPW